MAKYLGHSPFYLIGPYCWWLYLLLVWCCCGVQTEEKIETSAISNDEAVQNASSKNFTGGMEETVWQIVSNLEDDDDPDKDDDEGHYLFEGDMVIPLGLVRDAESTVILSSDSENYNFSSIRSKNSLKRKLKLWPNAIMPYIIDESFSKSEMEIIQGGMEEISEKTCFKFKPLSKDDLDLPHVHVVRKNNLPCLSQVGRKGKGGGQELNLSPGGGCLNHGTVIHELMHAMGFYHEQTRPDRDAYIDIHYDHLIKGPFFKAQFVIQSAAALTTFGLPYDYNSVMHYDRTDYSKDELDTISQKVGIFYIGQRKGLSETDAVRIKLLYGLNECNCTGFKCANGACIWSGRRCDYAHDCGEDNSDENDCDGDKCPSHPHAQRFRCTHSDECIRKKERCDGWQQCRDNSDEIGCENCAEGAFQCLSGDLKCANWKARCNGTNECDDGSDEANCTSCSPHDFRCESGQCVYHSFRCDGGYECLDHSDEINCTTCNYSRLRCDSGDQCIEAELWCDGVKNCEDGSDERNCSVSCPVGAFRCHSDGKCLPLSYQCDGYPVCSDGSDEKDCLSCPPAEFRCASGQCIPERKRCDIYKKDCQDGSDEENCGCDPDQHFACDNGKCTFARWRCNGYEDCEDKSDEKNCTFCLESRFLCDEGRCIHSSRRCNRAKDCEDGTDEENCPTCPAQTFTCDNGQCVEDRHRCNGRRECYDASDEVNCPSCSGTSIRCDNGLCIPALRGCSRGVCRSGHEKWRCREPLGANMTSEQRRPLFEMEEPDLIRVEAGQNSNLTCTVWHGGYGQPIPQFFWKMNGQSIDSVSSDDGPKIVEKDEDRWTSILVIGHALKGKDAGNFSCLAKNVNGMSTKIFIVQIFNANGPTESSTSLPPVVTSSAEASSRWTDEMHNNFPPF